MKRLLALVLVFGLAACGRGFIAEQMVASLSPEEAALFSQSPLRGEISVSDVESTFNPAVGASLRLLVPPEDIQSALSDSLATAGLLSGNGGQFDLTTVPRNLYLEGAFPFTFTAVVDYRLAHRESGEVVFEETVTTRRQFSEAASWSYVALTGEVERLIAGNFSDLIDQLSTIEL